MSPEPVEHKQICPFWIEQAAEKLMRGLQELV